MAVLAWAEPAAMMKAMMATLRTEVIQLRREVRRVPKTEIVEQAMRMTTAMGSRRL